MVDIVFTCVQAFGYELAKAIKSRTCRLLHGKALTYVVLACLPWFFARYTYRPLEPDHP